MVMSRSCITDKGSGIQPPQAKKEFTVGKYYKCTGSYSFSKFVAGCYYKLAKINGGLLFSEDMYNYVGREGFDINSESDYDPNTVTFNVGNKVEVTSNMSNGNTEKPTFLTSWLVGDIVKIIAVCRNGKYTSFKCNKDGCDYSQELSQYQLKKVVDTDVEGSKLGTPKAILEAVNFVHDFKPNDFSTTKEEIDMSNQRKVVEVQLFDDAKGLPVQDSLVAKFENVLTEDDNDTTIREVIMNNDIKKVLAAHNVKRAKVINQDILERTGNSVPLQPILLKDLRWKVIG